MNKVLFESSQNKFLSLWLSFVIFRISNEEIKLKFREIERLSLKIVNLSCHLSFNETCLNIYIYIHITFDWWSKQKSSNMKTVRKISHHIDISSTKWIYIQKKIIQHWNMNSKLFARYCVRILPKYSDWRNF